MKSDIDVNNVLSELLKTSSRCYSFIGMLEEFHELNMNEVAYELNSAFTKARVNDNKMYTFSDGKMKELSSELVRNYPESLLNVNLLDNDSRNNKNEIEIDFQLKCLYKIVEYMKHECDIWKLNGVEFVKFCGELIEMNIPFRMDIMNRLFNGSNEYGNRWKEISVEVNGDEYKMMIKYMMIRLGDLQYNRERMRDEIIKSTLVPLTNEILNDFENYLKAPSRYVKNDKLSIDDIMKLFSVIGIDSSNEIVRQYLMNYTNSLFCYGTKVLENNEYDDTLREWVGDDYKWKLIYRASEHGYTAESFHEYCDEKGPTLVVIKSSRRWIFGGYTTQSWSGWCIYYDMIYYLIGENSDDSQAFIFTLKNPHGVKPARYMKRKEVEKTICCYPHYGPTFGDDSSYDIYIGYFCNKRNSCKILNTGTRGYECHHEYKSSLFVKTAGPDEENEFRVSDYEVFGIDYENRENINKLCKHPDIIWEFIETNDISEDSLKQVDDDTELLSDLDTIGWTNSKIRVKISQFSFKNPSEFLPDTQLVNRQYDNKLREWCGDYQWKMIYRASEHGYTASSFHEYCDNVKGPTLIVIKSDKGWIFGGYTTQSWSGNGIYI